MICLGIFWWLLKLIWDFILGLVARSEPKEPSERAEKRSAATASSSSLSSTNSVPVKQNNSSTNTNSEKEVRKENKDREERESRGRDVKRERESSEKVITIKEKSSSKDSKRDKDDGESRKRDRGEKRSDRDRSERKYYSPVSPAYHPLDRSNAGCSYDTHDRSNGEGTSSPMYSPPSPMYVDQQNDRYYPDAYDERERDRDLSSISNSSKGSNNRRSQDSPDERDIKRRRVDNSKVRFFENIEVFLIYIDIF